MNHVKSVIESAKSEDDNKLQMHWAQGVWLT